MDILIKNMKLPKKGTIRILAVFSDGTVDFRYKDKPETRTTQAVEVPPHGRLIDADAEIAKLEAFMKVLNKETESGGRQYHECDCVLHYLTDAPTIVESST